MVELKRLHPEAIPAALERAEKYRLLNEPGSAESICRDVLRVNENNQTALHTMILAVTDQFDRRMGDRVREARALVERLDDEYARAYHMGLVFERQAKADLRRAGPGSGPAIYDMLRRAMECYEKAEALAEARNDEALLRWNTCARLINKHDHVAPGEADAFVPLLE